MTATKLQIEIMPKVFAVIVVFVVIAAAFAFAAFVAAYIPHSYLLVFAAYLNDIRQYAFEGM